MEGVHCWYAKRSDVEFEPNFESVDLYSIFEQNGKLDNDGKLPLSGFNLKNAHFGKARLSSRFDALGADFRNANLRNADFQKAEMPNSNFEGACLVNTRFTDAYLPSSKFRNVKMGSTRFSGANLSKSNFRDVNFKFSFLENANLIHAKLCDADLNQAYIIGADLSGSEPWRAKLIGTDKANSAQGAANCGSAINSISNLLEECKNNRSNKFGHVLYFRGESKTKDENGEWVLNPSIMRKPELRSNERNMLVELMARRPEDFEGTTSALSQWVIAQHHGLKTRLLDITQNPLVALFNMVENMSSDGRLHVFAVPRSLIKSFTSDTIRVIANFAKLSRAEQNQLLGCGDWTTGCEFSTTEEKIGTYSHTMARLYDLIRQEKAYFEEKIDPRDFFKVFVVEPQQSFARIRAQSGAFLISAFHDRFERGKILEQNSNIPVYGHFVYCVPAEAKEQIAEELRNLSIKRETLYPGLDETAISVMQEVIDYGAKHVR